MEVLAFSHERYRASASERRIYGGKTITVFLCMRKEDQDGAFASRWITIKGYGASPHVRKNDAIEKAKKFFSEHTLENNVWTPKKV